MLFLYLKRKALVMIVMLIVTLVVIFSAATASARDPAPHHGLVIASQCGQIVYMTAVPVNGAPNSAVRDPRKSPGKNKAMFQTILEIAIRDVNPVIIYGSLDKLRQGMCRGTI